MTFFLAALLAHAVADYSLQPERLRRRKQTGELRAIGTHGAVVLLCLLLATHPFRWPAAAAYSLAATAWHLVVELLRWRSGPLARRLPPASLACVTQLLQVAGLFTGWRWLDPALNLPVLQFYHGLLGPQAISVLTGAAPPPLEPRAAADTLLLVATGYISAVFGGAALVRFILDGLLGDSSPAATGATLGAAGRFIGMVERTLMYALVLGGGLSAVGFVLAAKSIARYKELEDRAFAEYYLIGTLASTAIALCAGLAVDWLSRALTSGAPF